MTTAFKIILGITAIAGTATTITLVTSPPAPVKPQVTLVIKDTANNLLPIQNVLGVSFPNLNSLSQVQGNVALTNWLSQIHAGYVAFSNGSISQWFSIRDSKGKFGVGYNCSPNGIPVCDECTNGATWSSWKDYLFLCDTMNAKVLFTANINSVISTPTSTQSFYSLLDSAKNDANKNHTSIGIVQLGAEQKTLSTSAQVVSAYNSVMSSVQNKFPSILLSADTYGNTSFDNSLMAVNGITAGRMYYSVQDTPATYAGLRTYAHGIGAATAARLTLYPNKKVVWLQCAFKNSNPLIGTNAHALFWLELGIDAGKYNVQNNNPISAFCFFNLKTLFDQSKNPVAPYYAVRELSKVFGLTYESSSVNATGLVTFGGKDSKGNYTEIILNPNSTSTTLNSIVCNGKSVNSYVVTNYSGNVTDNNFTVTNGSLSLPATSFSTITFSVK